MNEETSTGDDSPILLQLSRREAEHFSHGLSDLLCWCRGFNAALPTDSYERQPMGTHEARELNIKIKSALSGKD